MPGEVISLASRRGAQQKIKLAVRRSQAKQAVVLADDQVWLANNRKTYWIIEKVVRTKYLDRFETQVAARRLGSEHRMYVGAEIFRTSVCELVLAP